MFSPLLVAVGHRWCCAVLPLDGAVGPAAFPADDSSRA